MEVMADCKGKGKNACNIHELANVDRNKFGLSILTGIHITLYCYKSC